MSLTNTILRAVPGAFILNSASASSMDAETAESMQGMPSRVPLGKLSPRTSSSPREIAVSRPGTPFGSTRLAGLALPASSSMVRCTCAPRHDPVRRRASHAGGHRTAKDTWMLAIAGALLLNQTVEEERLIDPPG